MTGGVKTTLTTVQGTFDEHGNFRAGPPPPVALPLTPEEFDRQAASMAIEWVTYEGMTPPLKLKIRGTTEMTYRQVCRKYINAIGQEQFEQWPENQKLGLIRTVNSELYVLEWEGAQYGNGNPMPFSPSNLALLLEQDPHLNAFLSDEVARISPQFV